MRNISYSKIYKLFEQFFINCFLRIQGKFLLEDAMKKTSGSVEEKNFSMVSSIKHWEFCKFSERLVLKENKNSWKHLEIGSETLLDCFLVDMRSINKMNFDLELTELPVLKSRLMSQTWESFEFKILKFLVLKIL